MSRSEPALLCRLGNPDEQLTALPQGHLHVVGLGAGAQAAGLECLPLAARVENVATLEVPPAVPERGFADPAADVGFG